MLLKSQTAIYYMTQRPCFLDEEMPGDSLEISYRGVNSCLICPRNLRPTFLNFIYTNDKEENGNNRDRKVHEYIMRKSVELTC